MKHLKGNQMRLEEALKLSHMAIIEGDKTYYATKMAVVEERYGAAGGDLIYAGPVIDQGDVIGRIDWRPLGVMEGE